MRLSAGQQLQNGRYIIRQRLGQGGMGMVYLAIDRKVGGRLVAVKENLDPAPEAQIQFRAASEILARLSHPNLPRVIDHFVEQDGFQYLVMDYIAGEDLSQLLRQRGPLPEAQVLIWIDQVLDALNYLHSWVDPQNNRLSPVFHRDIKPGNIRITPQNRAVLVDFGLVKRAAGENTILGARGVTPGYSPVEQYTGGTDHRSDIYAVGATLYTLLTGRRPAGAPELAATTTLTPPRRFVPQISVNTERVILRAMSTQASDRYQTVAALRAALQAQGLLTTTRHFRFRGLRNPTSPQKRRPVEILLTIGIGVVSLLLLINLVASMQEVVRSTPISVTSQPRIALSATAIDTLTLIAIAPSGTLPSTVQPMVTSFTTATILAAERAIISATLALSNEATPTTPSLALPTVTPQVSTTATGTPTRKPTDTPRPTPTPQPTATTTPQPAVQAQSTLDVANPQTFTGLEIDIVEPPNGASGTGRRSFIWTPNFHLSANQAFEVVFSKDSQPAFGIAAPTTGNTLSVDLSGLYDAGLLVRGEYQWTVLLVEISPYNRLKTLSSPYSFFFEPGSSSSDNASRAPQSPLKAP